MSFIHGGFHDTCTAYEVITAAGEVLTCTPDNDHALVFQMMHGAFGTLGIVSKLTFKLVPAKPFVHLVYEHHQSLASFQDSIAAHAKARDLDFMDGIIHSPTHYVLCVGHFIDKAPYTSRYDWVKVYYQSTAKRAEDYLDTKHYFFRYNRGVTNVRPKSFVGRLLFGKFLQSSQWLRIAEKVHWILPKERPTITLDVFVPASKVPDFMAWWEQTCNFFPLWAVPYRRVHDYEWLADGFYDRMADDMFLDIAVYGMKQPDDGKNYHRLIEEKLRALGGIKTLISHNYYPEAEFWQIFNKRNYDAVKRITDPKNLFRDLYTKTCKAAMGKS
jgi:FAD/FMN-containing dehydrogenase